MMSNRSRVYGSGVGCYGSGCGVRVQRYHSLAFCRTWASLMLNLQKIGAR